MPVYTQVSDEALAEFLTAYDLGAALAFKGIAEGVETREIRAIDYQNAGPLLSEALASLWPPDSGKWVWNMDLAQIP